jgi:murein L,D-transpeptidase YafK
MNFRNALVLGVPVSRVVFKALAAIGFLWSGIAPADETWILIDTNERTLIVMQGEKPLREFQDVSIGRNGSTGQKISQDKKTPLGAFRVSRIKNDSIYHRFIGLNYPDLEYARRALEDGLISPADYAAILAAHEQGREPPADTPLGGFIGIHGIGDGDPRIHAEYNWTEGCVALSNEEVDELAGWIRLNMVVLIL